MMNNFCLLLLCHYMIFISIYTVDNIQLETINLTVISENYETININLIQVNSFLANDNMPMWIEREMMLEKINSTKVMMKLGTFTMYHDLETSSAVVYFHKQREFTGTIDHRYFIKHLSINDGHEELLINKSGFIFARTITGHHFRDKSMRNIDSIFFIQRVEKSRNDHMTLKNSELKSKVILLDEHPNIFYIETIVFVNHDIVEELGKESNDDYTSITSYLLTLFNSVDMLYSKIKSPRIKFNIAGIIVGSHRKSFLGLNKCYRQTNGSTLKIPKKGIVNYMDAYCTVNFVNNYLGKFWKLIPRESYDIAIFLTRYGLYINEYDVKTSKVELIKLGGSSRRYPTSGYHQYRVNDIKYVPSISVTDLGNFSSFPIIAHETAHLFGVKHDNLPVRKNGICTAKIMKTTTGYCKFCLSWSEISKNFMHIFFKSPDRCPFINEPRSLRNPGPLRIWTVSQQCQCYGHVSGQQMKAEIWINPDLFCQTHLQCKVNNGISVKAPIPMDGTPCDRNKVCWNKECRDINIINVTEQLNYISR